MKLCLMRFKVWMLSKRKIAEETEDLTSLKKTWRKNMKITVEEVRKQKNSLEIDCLGSILWLFYGFLEN
ncbi:unnamed protein product [Brassica rapa]|uniref:Uncharacterized protein n=1 Tax=Brassica campestris TaxID=3711 RepID=A0A8D9HKS0_BRACM|nr:unnamed protein product [Brassica rapa]